MKQSETIAEPSILAPAPVKELPAPVEPSERDLGAQAESHRCEAILNGCEKNRLPMSFARKLIADKALSLVDAQTKIIDEIARRGGGDVPTGGGRIEVGEDPLVHVRAGIENALLHRFHPYSEKTLANGEKQEFGFKLTDVGRQYRGMKVMRLAEAFVSARGERTSGMSEMEIVTRAFGLDIRGGMQVIADFPLLLADVAGKLLRQAYQEAPQTFTPISRQVTVPDFKEAKRLQLSEAPALEEILEHGTYKTGVMTEGQEKYQLKPYGMKFAITRKAIINDDTDAFGRVPMLFGRSARNLESDLVWTQITANANMADGVALFEATTHKNYTSSGTAISVDSLGVGRALMRRQTALGATTILNLAPRYLIVPANKETIADQFVTAITAAAGGSVNPFAGRLQVIAEPRLDANSLTAWYLAADPGQIDIIEYAYLEGETGPRIESRVGWDADGLEVKCGHDFAAKVIDYRGLYKNVGA